LFSDLSSNSNAVFLNAIFFGFFLPAELLPLVVKQSSAFSKKTFRKAAKKQMLLLF
jgi:hypothetical protein